MKCFFSRFSRCTFGVALIGSLGSTLAFGQLVSLNEFVTESDFSQNFTVTAGTAGLSVAHSNEDDDGIGRGGFVVIPTDTGTNTNFVYDTDDLAGTQTFGDITATIDQLSTHSVGFIVRGNASRDDSIRIVFTQQNRVRIWRGAGVNTHGAAALIYDETAEAAAPGWNHMQLHVRNVGEGNDQVELIFRVYNSQVLFDETTLATEHTYTFSVEDSAPYLGAGEIGFRIFGAGEGTRIDNFAVYEYGTAPVTRRHPALVDFHPQPGALLHSPEDGVTFRALSFGEIDPAGISLSLNGADVTGDLVVTGDVGDRTVFYPHLDDDTDYLVEIEVATTTGEITTESFEFRSESPAEAVPLVNLIDFGSESEFADNFTTTSGAMSYSPEWDKGIGEGGLVTNSGNTTFVYDTDGTGDTQTFQDFSATVDFHTGGSIAFVIRANRSADTSIRVMLSARQRMRVWTGSSLSSDDGGTLRFDETLPTELLDEEWCHVRLDARNVGEEEWDTGVEMTLSAFGSQSDFATPAFRMTFTLPSWESIGHIDAGEVGIRAIHGSSSIDNFGIYEYGMAPAFRPHPTIESISPSPDSLAIHDPNSTLSFTVRGSAAVAESDIQVWLDGTDVSDGLVFTGDEFNWAVSSDELQPGAEVMIAAGGPEATTTAFFEYAPSSSQVNNRPYTIYDSGGFEDESVFPLGDLQAVDHNSGSWLPDGTVPAQIVDAGDSFNRVLRRSQMADTQREWLHFSPVTSGILILDMDARTSTASERTLDLSFTAVGAAGRQHSFVSWGVDAEQFTYYDGSNWVSLFEPADAWHHYRFVHYLSGPYASTYDVIIDGELVGEKLPFRAAFDPDAHEMSAIRLNAAGGPEGEYIDIDNLVLTAQPLFGSDQLPVSPIRQMNADGTGFLLSFETHIGYAYTVEYTDELGSGEWTVLNTVSGAGGTMVVEDSDTGASRRFYRIVTTLE